MFPLNLLLEIFFTLENLMVIGYVRYSNIDDHFYNREDSRTISLTFIYRLGNKNIAKSRERQTRTVEEEKRIKKE